VLNTSEDECAGRGRDGKGIDEGRKEREGRVWVSFHEGFSNAVRKPVTLREIMSGL
jgi:chromosome transmission fidelity protein 18